MQEIKEKESVLDFEELKLTHRELYEIMSSACNWEGNESYIEADWLPKVYEFVQNNKSGYMALK